MIERLIDKLTHLVEWESILDEEEGTHTVKVMVGHKVLHEETTDLSPMFRAYDLWKAKQ